ncbi:hypothetical protein E1B28_007058 [Marasmius oreades]|uniref:F-box domain-containing protein n=1 Tax=Marasmius oreades TaxID=181124 RepID=A0A9P7UTE0_9AGAR|nr:uncharacterized protein E1B28_007058 [Marasmius oreades]KAG7093378.1 hypothetical protein E1B28_007058 [Marasmius oreades]
MPAHQIQSDETPPPLNDPLPNRFSNIQARAFRRTILSSERQSVSQCLLDAETDLKVYQAEIDRLKAKIMVLETRRDGLKERITKYRSLMSPVHRMPPEILTHILSFCCENVLQPGTLQLAVLALSSVCGRWRELVLATPRFWSSLTIMLHEWANKKDTGISSSDRHNFYHCTEMFMQRSKTELLALEFFSYYDHPFEPLEAGLNCLLDQSHRWRSVTVGIRRDPHVIGTSSSPFQRLRGRLPNLRHLALEYYEECAEDWITSDMNLFSACPSLTSLKLMADLVPTSTIFPWEQMHSLQLCVDSSHDALIRTIKLCKNLQQLKLAYVDHPSESTIGPITPLNEMQHLYVNHVEDNGSFLFDSFSLPALSSLQIDGHHYVTHMDVGPLTGFLLRSSCSITSLLLSEVGLYGTQMFDLLTLMPTLVKLSIHERVIHYEIMARGVTATFLEQLVMNVGDEQAACFLPRLEDLTLTIEPLESSSRQTLQRVLASRNALLRIFTPTVRNLKAEMDVADYELLRCFRAVGMRVSVSCQIRVFRRRIPE